MDIEEAYFKDVTPVVVDEKGEKIEATTPTTESQDNASEVISQDEPQKSSLNTESAKVEATEPTVENTPKPSVGKEDVFTVESDDDLAKFVSDHYGKNISKDRLKFLLEDPTPTSSYANDTIKEINEYVGKGGDLKDYMEFKMTNFSEMSDVDIVTNKMKREFPQLTKAQIDRKVNRTFKLNEDDFSEEEIEDGKIDLAIEAKRSRDYFSELTSQYSAPLTTKNESKQGQPEFSEDEIQAFQSQMSESVNNLKTIEFDDFKFEVTDELRTKVDKSPIEIGDMFAQGDSFQFKEYNQLRAIAAQGVGDFVKAAIKHGESKALASLKDKRNNTQLEPETHKPTENMDSAKAYESLLSDYMGNNNGMKAKF